VFLEGVGLEIAKNEMLEAEFSDMEEFTVLKLTRGGSQLPGAILMAHSRTRATGIN